MPYAHLSMVPSLIQSPTHRYYPHTTRMPYAHLSMVPSLIQCGVHWVTEVIIL